jgi:hypothetical protein
LKGVRYLIDEKGKKTAVLIDLQKNRQLWEDFCDLALARSRATEPRESLESVRNRITSKKRRSDG